MLHLIDNILELARIENNQATLDETITDVSKNFDLCIDMFRKPIEEKHQTLKVNKNIRYPYLYMDDASRYKYKNYPRHTVGLRKVFPARVLLQSSPWRTCLCPVSYTHLDVYKRQV